LGTKVSPPPCLVARRVGAQCVLYAVAELAQDHVGHVVGILRAEIDANAFRADQSNNLLDSLLQGRRAVIEQQVRFVEDEDQLGLIEIADLGKRLEQFGKQPQQEA
jgi:hypothetical protein